MYKKKLICLNCDTQGHTFKNCNFPVRSYGIIAYKKIKGENNFLLIQRKDTIGKTDFIRGKYKLNGVINYSKMMNLIQEMTDEEKYEILNTDKEVLWDNLWLDHSTGIYRNEKLKSMKLFQELDYKELILSTIPSRYKENEWGFPKGRKNLRENGISCAIREFQEETGLNRRDFTINERDTFFVEEFLASDNNVYTHIYYLAEIKEDVEVSVNSKNLIFKQEVKDIGFFPFKQAYKLFRDYDTKKKTILKQVNDYIE